MAGLELVLLAVAVVRAAPLQDNEASPLSEMAYNRSPVVTTVEYSREEQHCFERRQVYHGGRCESLLAAASCPRGEWLVLDKESRGLRPVCAPRLCPPDRAYWAETSSCAPLDGSRLCNRRDTSLQVDSFGLGACKCLKGAARAMAPNGACYLLYSKEPCDGGRVLLAGEDGAAACLPDPCPRFAASNATYLPLDGQCYPEGSRGPCPEGQVLAVDVNTLSPGCADELVQWHLIDAPLLCDTVDHKGDCRDRIYISKQKLSFLEELKRDSINRRKRKTSPGAA